jgi:hypothetical protein
VIVFCGKLIAFFGGSDLMSIKKNWNYFSSKIQRFVKDSGRYSDIATSVSTKAELIDQPRLTDMEYRVIAINKAGQSPPSNTVTVVL